MRTLPRLRTIVHVVLLGLVVLATANLYVLLREFAGAALAPAPVAAAPTPFAEETPPFSTPKLAPEPSAIIGVPGRPLATPMPVHAAPSPPPSPPPPSEPPAPEEPRVGPERLVMRTVAGDLVFALYPDAAPETVHHVLRLVRLGAFDTTHFGYVTPACLQLFNAEDRLTPLTGPQRDALRPIPAEKKRLRHRAGTLSLAREATDPHGGVSSLVVVLDEAPALDGLFTPFGHLESGLDVVQRLQQVPRLAETRPAVRLTVDRAQVATADDLTRRPPRPARTLAEVLAPAVEKAAPAATPVSAAPKRREPTRPLSGPLPRLADERIVLRTVAGDLVLALYPDVAPETTAQLLRLVRLGVYDTTHIGRLEVGFVLQIFNSEDRLTPFSAEAAAALRPIRGEFSDLKHRRGMLSMARDDGKPDSAVSSFSLLLGDAPHLDGKYTVFGHVEKGLDVLDRLEEMPRFAGSRPVLRLTVLQAEVVPAADLPKLILEPARPVADVLDGLPPPTLARRGPALLHERCVRCHGSEKPRGGLDLASRAGLLRGGKSGPAAYPGNATASLLHRRTHGDEAGEIMPPQKPLSVAERATLTAWINAGVPHTNESPRPDPAAPLPPSVGDPNVWSLAPLRRPAVPSVQLLGRARTPVDHFLLSALQAKGFSYQPEAERRVLVRRLCFDLLGVPPSSEEVDRFVSDLAPDAYERLVDRLLANPHFGERWGRHWLDLARYADSDGYEDDKNRPHAYPYRDFVLRAFNDDLPFDTFLRWQVAGDELEPANPDAVAATGFCTAGPVQTFRPNKGDRHDELDDIVSTLGVAFLGLSVGCARCHDHKHDPISAHDYYRLIAVFTNTRREERYLVPDGGAEYARLLAPARDARRRLETLRTTAREKVRAAKVRALELPEAESKVLLAPFDAGNTVQAALLREHGPRLEVGEHEILEVRDDPMAWDRLAAEVAILEAVQPPEPPKGLALAGSGLAKAYFLERGDARREREALPPGFPPALTHGRPDRTEAAWTAWAPPPRDGGRPLPRSALAHWLTDVESGAGRLAARVIVNRLWQHYFGEGLVRTPNDFGTQGDRPSHPELLDWLASELIASGWRLKPLHRLLACSSAYRQDASADAAKERADPENRLFGRRTARRRSGDALRDAVLVAGGGLNRQLYGPGVKPPIPAEAIFATAPKHGEVWPANASEGPDTWRRSVYIIAKRSNPVPFLQTFDGPDAAASCARRSTTTVPTQALVLMNDPFVLVHARRLAERVAREAEKPERRIDLAYRAALGRPAQDTERERALRFLREQAARHEDGGELAALADLCQVLFQLNEFAYVE